MYKYILDVRRTEEIPFAVGVIMFHEYSVRVYGGDVHFRPGIHPRLVHEAAVLFVEWKPSNVHLTVRGGLLPRWPPTARAFGLYPDES